MHSTGNFAALCLSMLFGLMAMCPLSAAKAVGAPKNGEGRSAVSTAFTNSLSELERAWLRDHPVIRVVHDPGWPPVEFSDERGGHSGMSADYLKLVEHRLGLTFERVQAPNWPEAFARLKRGEIDITPCVAVTPQRTEFWAFTQPYLTIPIVIATQMDVTYIADIRELFGKQVALVEGYAMEDWLVQDFPEIRLVRVKSAIEGLGMLQRGEVFAYVDNLLIIGYYQAKMEVSTIKIAGQTPYANAQCMAVRKDWAPLAGILQKALESISEAERKDIYRRWLPVRYEHGFNYALFWRAMAVFAVIILALILWNQKLAAEIRSRKRIEGELRQSESKFRTMVEKLPLAIYLSSGIEQRAEYLNPEFVRLFGYTLEDIPTAEQWWPLAYPDEIYRRHISEEWTKKVRRAIEIQSPIETMETVITCKNGSKKNISWDYIAMGDKNYACGLDLTALKRAEGSLRESLCEKESMLKEIHHRVKNNLQIISSLLRLQSRQIEHPAAKAVLQDMQNRVRSMALIHEHLYRSESLAQVDLAAYLNSLCPQLLRALSAHPGAIQLHLDLTPALLEIDQAIPCGLLVNELVSNAFKHAFPDGRTGEVRVELRPVEGGSELRLRVCDNGVGLPVGFDIKGLNSLGMRLVSDLTNQIGGRLEIGSRPGALFEVVFTPTNGIESSGKPENANNH